MFYVYVMLDQRFTGKWVYNELSFNYKPFYVGIGEGYRMTAHFTPYNLKKKSIKNNIIKSIYYELSEFPIFYKIYNNLTKEECTNIEIDFIKTFGRVKYKTGILSNLTEGGDGIFGFKHSNEYKNSLKKKIYQYDLNGVFIKEWESLKSVIDFYKKSGSAFRASINKGYSCNGFLWSYDRYKKLKPHLDKNRPKFKYKISKDGFEKEFKNRKEIFEFFKKNVSFGNVSSVCNGKLRGYLGYKWDKIKI